jgi:transposase
MDSFAKLAQSLLPKDLKLRSIRRSKDGYEWTVDKIRQDFEVCPKCATPSNIRAGRCSSKVRDAGLRGESLTLLIHKHRYLCKNCKKTFTEPVSGVWPRRRSTQRFRKALAQAAHAYSNLTKVKKDFSVSNGFVYQVYYEQIELQLNEHLTKRWPKVLGIDEHFFRRDKGFREFTTVFTDLGKKKMFEMAQGKSIKSLIKQVGSIPGREEVKYVSIDMSSTYRSFVKLMFPNAEIIADKFHVLRLLNPAIMSEGKKIHGHRQELKTRRKLLRSRIKLDVDSRKDLDIYLQDKSALRALYRVKEELFEFYRMKGKNRARWKLEKLIDKLKNSDLKRLKTLGRTLHRWRDELVNYFTFKITNGFTEAMNNTAKLVQKRGYGYKSFRNYRLRVLSACFF